MAMIMVIGRVRDALLEEADLVQGGKKVVKSLPASLMIFLVKHLRVSCEVNFTRYLFVKKTLAVVPLVCKVLSQKILL